MKRLYLFITVIFLPVFITKAQNDLYEYIAINEILMWLSNNGDGSHDPNSDGNGFYWPGGINATKSSIFEDGLVWGGIINGQIRVNGNTHRQGLQTGIILPNGEPADPSNPKYKIWRSRINWELLPPGPKRDRYEFDYLNWPVDIGAPWEDLDNNGIYTPGIDHPDYIGDEIIYYVANDLDSSRTAFTYGSPPIGLEFQTLTYGYESNIDLKDVVFKKYKIINKSGTNIDSMYLTYWADDDLGFAGDDYVGCDTVLSLGYTYNGDNDDNGGYGTPPPAVGHMIVQGPIIQGQPTDSALYNYQWIYGYKNLKISSSGPNFKNDISLPNDPPFGIYNGTIEFYNLMKGLYNNGDTLINPHTNQPTTWALTGDPYFQTGWYEGPGWPGGPDPADRRYHLNCGPFNMAPADTQEIVFAIFMAQGSSNIYSVYELKQKGLYIQHFYGNTFITDVKDDPNTVYDFSLNQNYPNPFNPTTTIEYSISVSEFIELNVFDILGREIATLVNEHKSAGKHSIKLDASSLTSGVYFYRLKAGDFSQSKKMLIIK